MGLIKTFVLMLGLMLLFMFVGQLLGGEEGMRTAFWIAVALNMYSYFFSDTMVLKHYKAVPVKENDTTVYPIVKRLAEQANLPMPKVYIVPDNVPNAFATGRNPSHAAVAVNQGLLDALSEEEVEGVLAHEMSHVKHRDILISSVAAVFAGAISMLANMFRVNNATQQNSNRRTNSLAVLIGVILMPIAAAVIQMSISRTREYAADEGAARLTRHPEWLMSALSKLEDYSKKYQMKNANSQTAHMFIVNPLSSVNQAMAAIFSTHPSTASRIERLAKLKKEL